MITAHSGATSLCNSCDKRSVSSKRTEPITGTESKRPKGVAKVVQHFGFQRRFQTLTVERQATPPHGLADQVRRADLGLLGHHRNVLPLSTLVGLLDGVHHTQRVEAVFKGGGHCERPPVPSPPVLLVLKGLPHRLDHADRSRQVRRRYVAEGLFWEGSLLQRRGVFEEQLRTSARARGTRVLLPVKVRSGDGQPPRRAHHDHFLTKLSGNVEVERDGAAGAPFQDHLEGAEVVAGDLTDAADVVRLLDKRLEEAVDLDGALPGQKREQVDDVAAHRVQAAASHQVIAAPVVLLPEQAAAVNLKEIIGL